MLRNIRDSFLVVVGAVQSFFKLLFWRPDVVFTKGGYVCLPVGLVVHFLRIPLVIHDSDAHPGLTNRVLSRWADVIATGAPLKYYNYPKAKSHYVGIPIDTKFHKFTKEEAEQAKEQWGLSPEFPVLVVTGGGLGATRINDAIVEVLSKLQQYVSVVLVSGVGQYDDLRSRLPANDDRFQLHAFITTMPSLLAAADVVVARAGATTLLELAATEKATILVPNGKLAGGHQLKNAKVYEDADAVLVLDEAEMEDNPKRLVDMIKEVIDSPEKTEAMTKKFGTFAKPRAAHDMTKLIISAGSKGEA